jgi:hypothetical protein
MLMNALTVLDTLIMESGEQNGTSSELRANAAKIAAALVDSLLAEYAGLRQLDGFLYPNRERRAERRVAQSLHAAWRQWADDAGLLLDRLQRLNAAGERFTRQEQLADAHGRTMAMLQITLERNDRACDQVKRGELIPVEEVRRELRAEAHR